MFTAKAAPLALLVFLAAAHPSAARASTVCVNDPDCVPAGSDYFVTTAGTFFVINGVTVPLMGIPDPTQGGADTIVQRLSNIDVADNIGAMGTVTTVMTELNLTGVDPSCPQGIGACDVFIHLDPVDVTTGTLTFTQTVNGEAKVDPSCSTGTAAGLPCEGTFTSFFDVFFDLSFTTLGGAPLPCDVNGDISGHACEQTALTLTGSGSWTDDNGSLFIVGGKVSESHPGSGLHDATQIPPIPEPGTTALLGIGLLGLVALSRKQRVRG